MSSGRGKTDRTASVQILPQDVGTESQMLGGGRCPGALRKHIRNYTVVFLRRRDTVSSLRNSLWSCLVPQPQQQPVPPGTGVPSWVLTCAPWDPGTCLVSPLPWGTSWEAPAFGGPAAEPPMEDFVVETQPEECGGSGGCGCGVTSENNTAQ